MTKAVVRKLFATGVFLSASTLSLSALAGPPMETEDTGMLDPGAWEFIVSVTADQRDSADFYELPGAEVSYGLNADSQVTVGLSRFELRADGEQSKSDLGYLGLEYKYRLWQGQQVTWVVVPGYSFPVTSSGSDRGIFDDVRVLALPVVASWEEGRWGLTGQLVYELTSTGPNAWVYGTMLEYGASDRLTLLTEVWGVKVVGESESETNWNVGADFALTDRLGLLASYGAGLRSSLPKVDELDHAWFLGLRYDIPGPN